MTLQERLHRMRLAHVNETRVASPCSAPWEEMEGDEKVRFCGKCQLHVFNLSAMDVEEAAAKIAQADDRLCVRFFRRPDGTILMQDCPVGAAEKQQQRRNLCANVAWTAASVWIWTIALLPHGTQGERVRKHLTVGEAAAHGDTVTLRHLLSQGISPDTPDEEGVTPLMWAAVAGKAGTLQILISRGADLDIRDHEGKTALTHARDAGHPMIEEMLLEAEARE